VDAETARGDDLPGLRRDPPDPAAAGFLEHGSEVRVGAAVAAVEERGGGDATQDLQQAAVVVARGVRGHDQRQAAHARAVQQPVRARLGRTAVEQHRGAAAVLDQRGVALADVEEADGEVLGRRRRPGRVQPPQGEDRGEKRGGERALRRRRAPPRGGGFLASSCERGPRAPRGADFRDPHARAEADATGGPHRFRPLRAAAHTAAGSP
jgi:hypothetical protein